MTFAQAKWGRAKWSDFNILFCLLLCSQATFYFYFLKTLDSISNIIFRLSVRALCTVCAVHGIWGSWFKRYFAFLLQPIVRLFKFPFQWYCYDVWYRRNKKNRIKLSIMSNSSASFHLPPPSLSLSHSLSACMHACIWCTPSHCHWVRRATLLLTWLPKVVVQKLSRFY